jgi:hypothetical protein
MMRDALLATTQRLQKLWEEAAFHSLLCAPVSPERQRWDSAVERLIDAMEAVEHFAGTVDPLLGRRDWRTRCQGVSAAH